ncbi:MAG: HPF/RaiA family ribosome-associated protein [Bacillota bacterium]
MQIQFKGTNYELTPDVTDLATRKIEGLEKYCAQSDQEPMAYLDMGRLTEAHQNGNVWYADCNFDVEGRRYYAKAEAETLRNALDRMTAELAKELRRDHKKRHTLPKRVGAKVKEMLRFG